MAPPIEFRPKPVLEFNGEFIMRQCTQFYINGQWVDPSIPNNFDVINPADESVTGVISLGSKADVIKAAPGNIKVSINLRPLTVVRDFQAMVLISF